MKKLMTLLLAVALLVGMSTASFAEKKLYLAYDKLEIEQEEEEEYEPEEEAPAPETPDNPETGGDQGPQAATNANMNPGTGR